MESRGAKFGFVIPQGALNDLNPTTPDKQFQTIREVAKEGESLGFDSGWLVDHLQPIPSSNGSCFEGWSLISALFVEIKRMRLGHLVSCNLFRHPSYLAKISSVVDVMSSGRLEFGIGAGWHEEECRAYGIPFPSAQERVQRLGEALQIIRKMWSGDNVDFEGKFYKLRGAINEPKPLQKPHPPILIGGNKKQVLGLVARYADKWNPNCPIVAFPEKLKMLREICGTVGRDFDSIEKTYSLNTIVADDDKARLLEDKIKTMHLLYDFDAGVVGTPERCLKTIQGLYALGVTYFIFILPNVVEIEPLKVLAKEVIPRFRGMIVESTARDISLWNNYAGIS